VADVSQPAGIDSGVPPSRFRLRRWQLVLIDVLVAAAIALLTASATFVTALGLSAETAAVVWLVALAVSVPLVVRRRWPIPVLGIVVASAIVAVLLGMSLRATALAIAVALYPVALSGGPRRSATALGAALLGITLAAVLTVSSTFPLPVAARAGTGTRWRTSPRTWTPCRFSCPLERTASTSSQSSRWSS
jgi:hypothetical protein